jgi:hypothetical protein
MIISIESTTRQAIAEYCHANISPRRYYLHDRIGGRGWAIYKVSVEDKANWKRQHSEYRLEVDNDYQALIIRLKWGV